MRYALVGLFFIVAAFMLFVGFAVGSYLVDETASVFEEHEDDLDSSFAEMIDTLKMAFGIFGILFLIMAILMFLLDSISITGEDYYYEEY